MLIEPEDEMETAFWCSNHRLKIELTDRISSIISMMVLNIH